MLNVDHDDIDDGDMYENIRSKAVHRLNKQYCTPSTEHSVAAWCTVVNTLVGLGQQSCSTPGQVTTWTGNRLQICKPSRYVTNRPGQLSLPFLWGSLIE